MGKIVVDQWDPTMTFLILYGTAGQVRPWPLYVVERRRRASPHRGEGICEIVAERGH
jgi:hypothetical protein